MLQARGAARRPVLLAAAQWFGYWHALKTLGVATTLVV
jgi:hypothetical protein